MPRTATTSITKIKSIKVYMSSQMGFIPRHRNMIADKTSDNLSICVRDHVGKQHWDNAYKFTTVRNPYDRAVSMWKHKSWNRIPTFTEFCERIISDKKKSPMQEWHIQDFYTHLFEDDVFMLDGYMRFENLQKDFSKICNTLKLPHRNLPHVNKSNHKHYTEYYDDKTYQIITEKYTKDIEFFGYKFGD